MGRSQRKKPSRQPAILSVRGGGATLPWEGATPAETNRLDEFRVPLIQIRVDVLRQSTVGDSVVVISGEARLLVSGPRGILGEVPPHYEHPLRRGGFTVGVLASAEPAKPAATIMFQRVG